MGSTGVHRPRGLTDAEFYTRELQLDRDGWELVAHNSSGNGFERTFYGAVRNPDGEVFAMVIPSHQSGREFIYKTMDETVGPNEKRASREVLEALSDTTYEYAKQWRAAAWKELESREALAEMAKGIKPGSWLRFERPIQLSNGNQYRFGRYVGRNRVALAADHHVADVHTGGAPDRGVPAYGTSLGSGWKSKWRLAQHATDAADLIEHIDPATLEASEQRAADLREAEANRLARETARTAATASASGQGRVSRGIPTGGQFAGLDRAESTVNL